MSIINIGSVSVIAHGIAVLGSLLAVSACGSNEDGSAPRATGGTGGPQAGASGAGGSAVMAGSGGASAAGGSGAGGTAGTNAGAGGTPSFGGVAGSAPATGGVSSGGAGGAAAGDGGAGGAGAGGTPGGNSGASGTSAGIAGTAGSSPSAGGAGSGGTSGSAGSNSEALSFAADIWPVFEKVRDPVFVYRGTGAYESCTTTGVCHGGDDPGAGLSMANAETAYDQLLGVPANSVLCGDTDRVLVGEPELSCLILFYEQRLRDDLEWVDTAEIDLVRQWIAEGARP
jgi:hypothetical protein